MSRKTRRIIATLFSLLMLQNIIAPAAWAGAPGEDPPDPVKQAALARLDEYRARLDELPPAIQARFEEFARRLAEGVPEAEEPARIGPVLTAETAMSPRTMTAADESVSTTVKVLTISAADRGDGPPDEADLALAGLTEATPLLRRQADLLDHDPVSIYNFLRRSIRHRPYAGAARDAETVLKEGVGNDLDCATLCIALLRLAGVPCRYAEGEVMAPAVPVRSLLGVSTTETALRVLGESGIVASAAQESFGEAVRFRRHWVRAYLDYTPFRGAAPGLSGQGIWIDLDPSWQRLESVYTPDLRTELGWDGAALMAGIRAEADIAADSVTGIPADKIRETLNDWSAALAKYASACGIGAGDLAGRPAVKANPVTALPASLPYRVVDRQSWSALPEGSVSRIAVSVDGNTFTLPLPETGIDSPVLSYEPATPDDTAVFRIYRDEEEFPAFLVRLVPVARLHGEEIWRGPQVEMGRKQTLSCAVETPGGIERGEIRIAAGSRLAIHPALPGRLDMAYEELASGLQAVLGEGDSALGRLLSCLAAAWDLQSGRLMAAAAAQTGLRMAERPGLALAGLGLDVSLFRDCPLQSVRAGYGWRGRFQDAR